MANTQRTPTTGPPFDLSVTGGHPPLRMDINELFKDKIAFSIFVQAMARMQAESETKDLSYFQISGIHGLPFVAWQDAQGAGGVAAANTGYCTHNTDLFPVWHRPYLALFEQILCEHAKIIGEESKDQEWIKTAENLRLPYWDWAIRKMLPPFLTTPTIDVLKPDGTTETLQQSPLFSYTFREGAASIRTVRPPNGASTFRVGQWLDDEDSWVLTEEIRDNVILMFKNIHDWYNFSNDAQLVSRAEAAAHANSLEAIHDDVHGAVGGFMGAVPKAAFDPVFWLHHCNIDRFFALWQVLNPDVWVEPRNNGAAVTWTIPRNETISADTPLTPFYSPDKVQSNGFWTSAEIKSVNTFGYSYPELAALKTNNPRAEMLEVVTNLYGQEQERVQAVKIAALRASEAAPPVLNLAASVSAETVTAAAPTEVTATAPVDAPTDAAGATAQVPLQWWDIAMTTFGGLSITPLGRDLLAGAVPAGLDEAPTEPKAAAEETKEVAEEAKDTTSEKKENLNEEKGVPDTAVKHDTGLTDWFARISVEKYALGDSFRVCIFIVPDETDNSVISETDSSGWPRSPYYVGQMCAFVNSVSVDSCANCVEQRDNDLVIEGYVPLDRHIVNHSGLTTFGHEEVHSYLHKNMVWRVQKVDGPVVQISEIPSLTVAVYSTTLVCSVYDWKNSITAEWTEPHCHVGITAGQPGGCQHTSGPYTPMLEVQA